MFFFSCERRNDNNFDHHFCHSTNIYLFISIHSHTHALCLSLSHTNTLTYIQTLSHTQDFYINVIKPNRWKRNKKKLMKFVVIAQLQQKNTHLMYSHIARFVSESVRFDSMSCQIPCTVTRCAAFLSWFFNYYLSSLLHTWYLCLCFAIVFSLSTQQKPLVSFQMRSCVYSTVNIFALFFICHHRHRHRHHFQTIFWSHCSPLNHSLSTIR